MNMKKVFVQLLMLCVVFTGMLLSGCTSKEEPVEVTGVVLNIESASVLKGETLQLRAVVKPSNATAPVIEWQSANESIATVDAEGLVEGVSVGETKILVRSSGLVAECKINVIDVPVEALALDSDFLELDLGKTGQLTAAIIPQAASGQIVTWASTNPKVATVDQQGLIMTAAAGETLIKATCGEASDSCYVFVMNPTPQIGDYYYPNGKWYPVPITGQTPIAIIFYAGNPSAEDKALKSDHSECVNGLATALFCEKSSLWQRHAADYGKTVSDWAAEDDEASQYILPYQGAHGDYLNSIMGYNNTKVLELFNADPANSEWPVDIVKVIEDWRTECPLPANTSGWYLPSAKELSLLCSGKYDSNIGSMSETLLLEKPMIDNLVLLNSKIFNIPGAYLFSPDYYHSSTEAGIVKRQYDTIYTSWHIKMSSGYIFSQDMRTFPQAVRPVFAF